MSAQITMEEKPKSESALQKLLPFAGEALIVGLAIGPALAGLVGSDFFNVFRRVALDSDYATQMLNTWPARWLYYPFAIMPLRLGTLCWGLAQAIGYIYALRKLSGNTLWFALSLPCIWTFTEGQNEGFMAWGLALGLCSPALLAGVGITLLSLKPQVGLPLILYILYKRRDWRLLVAPAIVYCISLLVWGFWIDDWINTAVIGVSSSPQLEIINVSLFPYALVLLPIFIAALFADFRLTTLSLSLMLPYFAFYTYAAIMTTKWRSRWSIPTMVIGSWLLIFVGEVLLSGTPPFQIMGLVTLLTLVIEGRAAISKIRSHQENCDSPDHQPEHHYWQFDG